MRVEVLTFAGCPNADAAVALVRDVAAELGVEPALELVDVPDAAAAERVGFPGSPTVRVDGLDVDPGTDPHAPGVFGCRVYRTERGPVRVPPRAWVASALERARGR
jgi:hypothetical protein